MTNNTKIGNLEEEALKRKERLKALKNKTADCKPEPKKPPEGEIPKPVFRSYIPKDESLKETVLPQTNPGDVENEIKDQLEAAKCRVVLEDLDITSLAPRKPDWDLKRDVSKKLEILEKRTQRAIAELIRERLKSSANDLATAVNIGADANRIEQDDD